jgi:protein TonB
MDAIVPAENNVKPPLDAPLEVLAAPLPDYPKDFARTNLEGTVRLRFVVEPDGTVRNVEVVGSPPAPLAAVSVNAILQWKFKPLKRDGQPVKVRFERDIVFRLE